MKKLIFYLCFCALFFNSVAVHAQNWKVPPGFEVLFGTSWQKDVAEISGSRRVKDTNRYQYGVEIFGNGVAQTLGFKPVRIIDPGEYYTAGGWEDIEEPTEIIRQPTSLIPAKTLNVLKKDFGRFLKDLGRPLLETQRIWILYYTEMGDPDGMITQWTKYKADLKAAYTTIRNEVIAIATYDDTVKYIKCEPDPLLDGWKKYLPSLPE